jgi:hypothetical protein
MRSQVISAAAAATADYLCFPLSPLIDFSEEASCPAVEHVIRRRKPPLLLLLLLPPPPPPPPPPPLLLPPPPPLLLLPLLLLPLLLLLTSELNLPPSYLQHHRCLLQLSHAQKNRGLGGSQTSKTTKLDVFKF